MTEKTTIGTETNARTGGKVLRGVVVKTAMKDTATVEVTRYIKDRKYKKYVRRMKKYLVHDPGNTVVVGEKVSIVETKPYSKRKTFKILK